MKPDRNSPCPCGSGTKYKKCCGQAITAVSPAELGPLLALASAGRYAELETRTRELLRRHPTHGPAWKLLSMSLWMQGKDALAALERTAAILTEDAEAQTNLGNALRTLGRLDEAVTSHRRAIAIAPRYAEAHNNLGSALRDLGHLKEALGAYRRAIAIKPDFGMAHANLGDGLRELGQLDDAAESYRQALGPRPDDAEVHSRLGVVLMLRGRSAEAETSCLRALELNPTLPAANVLLAQIHAQKGELVEAEARFQRAASIDPDLPEAWAGVARCRDMTSADAAWRTGAERLAARPLPPRREAHLRYALGKYFDDLEDFEAAFLHYRRANDLRRLAAAPYEADALVRAVDLIIRSHDRAWSSRLESRTGEPDRPVFVVGMWRSGTSLAEQILASHPAVFGAGELRILENRLPPAPDGALNRPGSENAHCGTPRRTIIRTQLAESLARRAPRRGQNARPTFFHLGIDARSTPERPHRPYAAQPHRYLPVHLFSGFQRMTHPYAYDLENLAHYYTQYAPHHGALVSILPAGRDPQRAL